MSKVKKKAVEQGGFWSLLILFCGMLLVFVLVRNERESRERANAAKANAEATAASERAAETARDILVTPIVEALANNECPDLSPAQLEQFRPHLENDVFGWRVVAKLKERLSLTSAEVGYLFERYFDGQGTIKSRAKTFAITIKRDGIVAQYLFASDGCLRISEGTRMVDLPPDENLSRAKNMVSELQTALRRWECPVLESFELAAWKRVILNREFRQMVKMQLSGTIPGLSNQRAFVVVHAQEGGHMSGTVRREGLGWKNPTWVEKESSFSVLVQDVNTNEYVHYLFHLEGCTVLAKGVTTTE